MAGTGLIRWWMGIICGFDFYQGSGPMTYHATALAESFLSAPNAGDLTGQDEDFNFPYETNHFFFLDAIDVVAPADTRVLVGAGSSSVDGSITTPDNNDRFLNWMSRRLHAAYGNHVSVVNEGIGGHTAGIPTVLPPVRFYHSGRVSFSRRDSPIVSRHEVPGIMRKIAPSQRDD